MNNYVEVSKRFVITILNQNINIESVNAIYEINNGNTKLLLEHLKAITNIMNKAINELESRAVLK